MRTIYKEKRIRSNEGSEKNASKVITNIYTLERHSAIGNGKIKYPYSSQHSARCFDCPLTQSDNGLYLLNGSKTNECGKSLLHNSCEY